MSERDQDMASLLKNLSIKVVVPESDIIKRMWEKNGNEVASCEN